jgi:hypothetical protein
VTGSESVISGTRILCYARYSVVNMSRAHNQAALFSHKLIKLSFND